MAAPWLQRRHARNAQQSMACSNQASSAGGMSRSRNISAVCSCSRANSRTCRAPVWAEAFQSTWRWGESSPGRQRQPNDLGRFGLGMKTASVSMGRSLTVASRGAPGEGLRVLRWDLDHIAKVGWRMLDGPDAEAEGLLARSALAADGGSTGTVVIVTQLDRLAGWASPATDAEQCEAALAERISRHLGMVFHRFIAD